MTDKRVIIGTELAEALAAAGIIDNLDTTGRIVIDINARDVVRIYIDRFGDDRLLRVIRTLEGIEILQDSPETPVAP